MFDFDILDEKEASLEGAVVESDTVDAPSTAGPESAASDNKTSEVKEIEVLGFDAATKKGAQLLKARQAAAEATAPDDKVVSTAGDPVFEGQRATSSPASPSSSSSKSEKKIYWKVVKTIDAGGITVRSDVPHAAGGRLQLHSVVLEKERNGSEIRYEGISGRSWGPRSGWVRIESKGTIWLECLGTDGTEAIMPAPQTTAKHLQALILFDWDDTLCPTSWIEDSPQLRGALDGRIHRGGEVWDRLSEQARAVKELIQQALSLATVALVTLAERPWVAVSARDFMPEADEVVAPLEVFYAREGALLRPPPGACPLTAMKRRAMSKAVEVMLEKLGQGTTWESFISIGDSEVEKRAAQDLGRECQNKGVFKYTKTVKLAERPNVRQLTSECRALQTKLREFVNFPGHRHINSSDLLRSR